jgi:hypothetical protein
LGWVGRPERGLGAVSVPSYIPCVRPAPWGPFERAPLPLLAIVLVEPGDETGGDVEAAKARTLAAHLAARPQDVGRKIEWTAYRVRFVKAAPPPGDDELAVKASH